MFGGQVLLGQLLAALRSEISSVCFNRPFSPSDTHSASPSTCELFYCTTTVCQAVINTVHHAPVGNTTKRHLEYVRVITACS